MGTWEQLLVGPEGCWLHCRLRAARAGAWEARGRGAAVLPGGRPAPCAVPPGLSEGVTPG